MILIPACEAKVALAILVVNNFNTATTIGH
jgi:hypothetical protein